MSREIDPHNMTADDVIYVQQRPSLRREFIMQGFGDPLDPDYPGLVEKAEPSETDEAREAREAAEAEVAEAEAKAREAQEAELAAQRNAATEGGSGPDDANHDGDLDEDDLPENKRWNKSMSNAELEAVIEARNADYGDDEQIEPDSDKKKDLIAALEQDDEELLGEE